jgi:hypothetical protein
MCERRLNSADPAYKVYELPARNGGFKLNHIFESEGQYALAIAPKEENHPATKIRFPLELRVYAVEEDLYRLRPYMGDMHVHTCYSDGREDPAIVAANYRKAGFDFLAITDHEKYEPSLEAIEICGSLPGDLRVFPGEEVHPPENGVHYIHFGGSRSVNALIRSDKEAYLAEVRRMAAELDIPPGVNREIYASTVWVCREIHKAGGLAVMVHPNWIHEHGEGVHGRAYHVPERLSRELLKSGLFDAFEVIGGQTLEENLPQISLWQEVRAEGRFVPPLGNSDSHGTVNAEWFEIAKTIVLAERCDRESLFEAIRAGRTAALEQYHGEPKPRLYGLHRYVMFILFLLEEYFPLHDELCFEEGRLMKDCVFGENGAADLLWQLRGRCESLMKQCWGC